MSAGPSEPERLAHEDVTVVVHTEDAAADEVEDFQQAATPRRRSQLPEGVQVPTMGLPAWKYRANRLLGNPEKVPRLNRKERRIRAKRRIASLEAQLIKLARQVKLTIYFANSKGGASKTTTAVYFGSILADVTKQVVILVPATHNTSTCTAAFTAGIKVDPETGKLPTLTISELTAKFDQLPNARDVYALVPPTKYGLRVIAEDGDDVSVKFSTQNFLGLANKLHQTAEVSLYDGANDTIDDDAIPMEALRESDIVVFTGTADILITLNKLSSTFRSYKNKYESSMNVEQIFEQPADRTERNIPFLEKVMNSVVVVSGVRPEHEHVGLSELHEELQEAGFTGLSMTVPYDEYIHTHPDNADIRSLDIETYLAYLELIVATYEQARELRKVPELVSS